MARIHQPKQRQSTQRWDYTVSSDDEGWTHAEGYCTGFPDFEKQDELAEKHGWPKTTDEERAKLLAHKDKFHKDGHATADEATGCYRNYQLDFEVRKHTHSSTQKKCQECGEWTQDEISIGQFFHFPLCSEHQGRAILEKLFVRH